MPNAIAVTAPRLGSLALGLALVAGVVPAPAFALPWTALHFSTGMSFNHTLAVGDLDGDGTPDVATPNSQASVVTVLLGNGDGTLAPFQAYATFSEPQDVRMADLTGDGVLDLVTADYAGGGVTVLRGLGDGTFAPRKAHAIGTGLVSLVAADLNDDARLDLAVSWESNSRIAILTALPDSGFAPAVPIVTGTTPHQIDAADLDHDGRPDIAVASHGAAAVSVHLGDGTSLSPATAFAAGAAPIGVTIADLDLDGDADLVVSNVNAATISVLLGNGDGTFAPPVARPTAPRPRGMDAGDLDGDGVPEVVVATGYPDGDSVLTVYRGVGDGTLALLEPIALPYRAADCVIADMNGDGHRDIVATGPFAGGVSVLLNPGPNVGAQPPRPAGLALGVLENPARGSVSLRLRSPAGEATLEVFDLAGRRLATFGPFAASPDARHIRWDGEAVRANSRPGLYLARLTAGAEVVHARFVLLPR
jgi:hypothetical protein